MQGGTVAIPLASPASLRHFYVLAKNSLTLRQFCQHIKNAPTVNYKKKPLRAEVEVKFGFVRLFSYSINDV